jgi:hypothetical protein
MFFKIFKSSQCFCCEKFIVGIKEDSPIFDGVSCDSYKHGIPESVCNNRIICSDFNSIINNFIKEKYDEIFI